MMMASTSLFLLLVVVLLAPVILATLDATGCPIQFQERCHCGPGKYPNTPTRPKAPTRFIVNCTNSGFTDASMLKFLPNQTEVLIFTGNKLGELPTNIFGKTDYDDLDVVDFSNNAITFIPGKAFHRVYNVRTLYLSHNDIEISERRRPRILSNFESLENLFLTNAFTETVNSSYYLLNLEDIFDEGELAFLKKLHLEQNEIYTIGRNASIFCQLPSLEQLYLGDNRLSDLDFNLKCMPGIHYIDLQHNSINQLSVEAMERLDKFTETSKLTLELQQNPFMCDCYSTMFIKWLNHTKVSIRDHEQYRCADGIPRSVIGHSLRYIEPDSLKCPIEVEAYHRSKGTATVVGYSSSTVATLSILFTVVSALLLAIAYYHRKKIKSYVQPQWEYVTRKIGYSGLANEEINTKPVSI